MIYNMNNVYQHQYQGYERDTIIIIIVHLHDLHLWKHN